MITKPHRDNPAMATNYLLRSAHIFVRDLPAARRFYGETLGIPVLFETDAYLGLDTGTCGLMVFATEDAKRPQTALHLGVTDIAAEYPRLKRAGVNFHGEPKRHDWGGIMVDLEDPDGNVLHLVQYPD